MSFESLALHTDFYQLTMAAAYHDNGMNETATFSLFAHGLPPNRGYIVAAGLEGVLDYLEDYSFSKEDLDYLSSLNRFSGDFISFLSGTGFTGQVRAVPEGTICFAGEPLIEITAPIIEAQLVETFIINQMNLHSTLACKAARCVQAADGRALVDFSLRRTHGREAGLAAARSSAMVGFKGTSNVAAARLFGIRPVGTMAHAFVEACGDEVQAFEAFARTFPDHTVLLVDTYDSFGGIEHAIQAAARLAKRGRKLVGIRIDSGDLTEVSIKARKRLNQEGLADALVVVSGSLDEFRINELVKEGDAIDMMGVGTKMGSSADAPYLDLAYKLVMYDGRPTLKLSKGKETWVAPKQVWRKLGGDGLIESDLLGLAVEEQAGMPLLETVMEKGRRLAPAGGWREAKERFNRQIQCIGPDQKKILEPKPLVCRVSPALEDLQKKARARALGG